MKMAIIGANGKSGQLLVAEALKRGHDVTAIVRSIKSPFPANVNVLEKDLFQLTYEDVAENDVIIDAFGTWAPETLILHQTSLQYISDLVSNKPNRLIVMGGAGSLFVDAQHTLKLMDSPTFPPEFKPLASNMGLAFDALQKRKDVKWTYFSPSAIFDADGARTGKYRLGKDELLVNAAGESVISYADAAIAVIDEAENGRYIQKRFTAIAA